MAASAATVNKQMETLSGKYLSLKLGTELYGLAILKIQEIIGLMSTTAIPKAPKFVRGIINLRGTVIAVVDLRLKFNMDERKDTERTCIIVVQVRLMGQYIVLGLVVDEVCEVLDIPGTQIEPPPTFGQEVDTGFIRGIGKVAEKVIMLLDVDLILSGEEAKILGGVVSAQGGGN